MRAGLLKEPIEVWRKIVTRNDYGEETEDWYCNYRTRARLLHDGGSRVIDNQQVFYEHAKTFEIRLYVPVDDYDKILWNGKFYRITNIEPDTQTQKQIVKTELIDD